MIKIWLNHVECDLPADRKPIRQRLRGVQLNKLGERQTDVTETFSIPATVRNMDAIRGGNWWPCTILQDGVDVIRDGRAMVEEITADEIKLTAYGENSTIFQEFARRSLSDLDYSADAEAFTLAALYTNDRLTTTALVQFPTTVCWPIAQFGQITNGNSININYLRPAFMLRGLTDKIASEAGITFAGSIWHEVHYLLTCLLKPSGPDGFQNREKWERDRFFSYAIGNTNLISGQIAAGLIGSTTETFVQRWSRAFRPSPFFDGEYFTDPTGANEYTFYYSTWDVASIGGGGVTGDYVIDRWAWEFVRDVGGVETVLDFAEDLTGSAIPILQGSYTDTNIVQGTRYFIRFSVTVTSATGVGSAFWTFRLTPDGARFEILRGVGNYALGSTLDYSALAPNMTQAAYLKMLANFYGLIYNYDKATQTITATTLQEVLTNTARAVDWTAYAIPAGVGKSPAKQTSYRLDGWGQRTRLAHLSDQANANGRGNGTILIPREDLPDETTAFTVPCASGRVVELPTTGAECMEIMHYETDGSGQLNSKFDPALRVALIYPGFDFGLQFIDGGGGVQGYTANKFPLYFSPQTEFFSGDELRAVMDEYTGRYYSALSDLLNNWQAVEFDAIIPATDIRAFKFDRLVYVEAIGNVFVEEITGWAPGEVCTVRGAIVP